MRCEDLTGKKYNKLLIVEYSHKEKKKKQTGWHHFWKCLCDCGNTKIVRGLSDLKNGKTVSCGCVRLKNSYVNTLTHGRTKTKEYRSWSSMKKRCYTPSTFKFEEYGGRGIKVCDRWKHSFENFLEDMGECPENFTLDRKSVDGNYYPDNCRWADLSTQAYNQRKSKRNTTGKVGVTYMEKDKLWIARISFKNERIYLGSFHTYEDAVKARELGEIKYYGEIKHVTK